MNNKYIKSLGGEEHIEMLGTEGRITAGEGSRRDEWQQTIRPQRLSDYIGQSTFKENLHVYISAARSRKEALDHVLLYGPPGLGKTTMAKIISNELGVQFKVTSGPAIGRPGDLAAILSTLQEHDVLFIDEIHRLNRSVEEILYPAMEDFALDIVMGKGAGANSIRIELPPFTLIGATTRAGALSAPLRDRFGIINHMQFYTADELKHILIRAAGILNIKIEETGAEEIARRSRGTPRIANRLLKRIRDFAQVKGEGVISQEIAADSLSALYVDDIGLDLIDREVLKAIIQKFNGGPVGIDTISASISEERATIEDICEPYLMQIGFISRTPRGRIATKAAYDHLGAIWSKETVQDELFEGDNGFWKNVDCFRNFYDHSRCGNRFQQQIFLVGAVAGGYSLVLGKDEVFLSCRLIFSYQYCRNNSFKFVF